MAQKRHFMLLIILSVFLAGRVVQPTSASCTNTTEAPDAECYPDDEQLDWRVNLDCSVPNVVTLSFTDATNGIIVSQRDYFGEEVRLECFDSSAQQTNGVVCSDKKLLDIPGGPYTFNKLNESGIHPGWTCKVDGCFYSNDGEEIYYRTQTANCILPMTVIPTTSGPEPLTGAASTLNTAATKLEEVSTSAVDIVDGSGTNNIHIIPSSISSTLRINSSTSNMTVDTTRSTTDHAISGKESDLSELLVVSTSLPTIILVLLICIILLGVTICLIMRRRHRMRKKMLLMYNKQNMVFDPAFNPSVSIDKPAFFSASRLSTTSLNLLQSLNPTHQMNIYVEEGHHQIQPHVSFESECKEDRDSGGSKSIIFMGTKSRSNVDDVSDPSVNIATEHTESLLQGVVLPSSNEARTTVHKDGTEASMEHITCDADPLFSYSNAMWGLRVKSSHNSNDSLLTDDVMLDDDQSEDTGERQDYANEIVHPSEDYVLSNTFSDHDSRLDQLPNDFHSTKTSNDFERDLRATNEQRVHGDAVKSSNLSTYYHCDSPSPDLPLTDKAKDCHNVILSTSKYTVSDDEPDVSRFILGDSQPNTMTTGSYIFLHPPIETTLLEDKESLDPDHDLSSNSNDYSLCSVSFGSHSSPASVKNNRAKINLDLPYVNDSDTGATMNGYIPSESLTREIHVPPGLVSPSAKEPGFTVHLDFSNQQQQPPVVEVKLKPDPVVVATTPGDNSHC